MFFGDSNVGQPNAAIYTIIESCRPPGMDPYEYLRDVLTPIAENTGWPVDDLTPE